MMEDYGQKLVSIGLITYNRAPFLRRALDSVLSQTYKNFTLLISDNASTDETPRICEEYARKDPRIRYVRQKENIGAIANLNFVICEARGDYFAYLGDDDIWDPKFLEKCVTRLEANPSAAMALSRFSFLFEGEREVEVDPSLCFPAEKDLYHRLKRFILFYVADGKATLICGVWRRKIIEGDSVGYGYADDAAFVLRGLARGHFEFVDELLFKKGVYKEPPEGLSIPRLHRSFLTRVSRIPVEISNIRYIARIGSLSSALKLTLIFWSLFVIFRFFVQRKR